MTGPTWTIPMEIVRASANRSGVQEITRLSLRHAVFQPHARVELVGNGWVAHCGYDDPKYPGRRQEIAILLIAVPQENAA